MLSLELERRDPMSRRVAALFVLLFLSLLALACGATSNVIPPDVTVRPGHEVVIDSGAAVRFLAFDGEDIDATRLIAAPGRHRIDFIVRRNLRTVDDMMDGVFHTGECDVELDAAAGGSYLVRFAASQEVDVWRNNPHAGIDSMSTALDTRMLLEDRITGDVKPIPCEFYFDCRRLKEGVSRSSGCRNY